MTNIIELCITSADLTSLRTLLESREERCAVLFAAESHRSNGETRLLVHHIEHPEQTDYSSQDVYNAELAPSFVARVTKKAKSNQLTLIFAHTHPGEQAPTFSVTDDQGERVLAEFLSGRGIEGQHAALVMSAGGMRARLLGRDQEIRIVTLGTKRVIQFDPTLDTETYTQVFDRQVRAFGTTGQQRLERLRVAIVGLGGTGSIAAQQLVHLGVRDFVLIDPDVVEEVNLNRVVTATPLDLGSSKVSVITRYLQAFNKRVSTVSVVGNVAYEAVARKLIDADLIFCCTDSHGSRAVLQQIAYQHLIPCIDIGSTITQENKNITGIFGRVQLLAPGLPCLWCSGLLDAAEVRRDMMNESERRLDPYIVGAREPAPSVISLNGTVVSLAISMFLGIVAGAPIDATHMIYNACASTLRPVQSKVQPNCFICSPEGALGRGDGLPLFARRD